MRWSIRAKLTAVVLAVLLPLVALALFKFWIESRESHERAQERLLLAAQVVGRHLDEMLTGQSENLEALVVSRAIDRVRDEDLAALVRRVQMHHPFVRCFFIATSDGRMVAASRPRGTTAPSTTATLAASRAFQEALRTGELQVGAPQPSAVDGRPVVLLTMGAFDPARAARWVVGAELDLAGLAVHLDGMPVGGAGIALLTTDVRVVARSRAASTAGASRLLATADALRLVRRGGAAAEWRGEDGRTYVVGTAALARAPWVVMASVPGDVAAEIATARLRGSLLALGGAMLLGLAVAAFISRRMHGAVAALVAGARGLAAGRPAHITVPGGDELAEVAQQFNRAIEGRQGVEAELEVRQRRFQALAEVNRLLSEQLDAELLLQQVTDALVRLTGAYTVVLWGVDMAARRLVRRAYTANPSLSTVELRDVLTFEEGVTGWVATHRRLVVIDDIRTDPRVMGVEWAVRHDLIVLVGAPVEAGGELAGVLTLNFRRGHRLGPDDLELLQLFASQAAVAIRNAELFADARARRSDAEAVADLGHMLAQALDPELLAPKVADSIRALLRAESSGLYQLDPDSGDLVALALSGDVGADGPSPVVFRRGTGLVALAVSENTPVWTANLLTDPRVALTPSARERLSRAPYRSVLAVPLSMKGTVIGALAVGDREGRAFTADEIRLAQTFADQAALALENARLFVQGNRRRREAEELARVARMFTESLDVTEVGRRIADSLLPLFGASSSGLYLLEADGSMRAVAWGGRSRDHFEPAQVFAPGVGVMGRAVSRQATVWCRDILSEPDLVMPDDMRRRVVAAGNRALLAVPLRVKGQIIGVLSIAHAVPRDYTPAEVALLEAFGDQAAVALENARLFATAERRRREAEELARVGRALAETLDPDMVASQIVESIYMLLGVRSAVLFRLEPASGDLVSWVASGTLGEQMPSSGFVFPKGTGLAGLAVRERQPLTSTDVLDDPRVALSDEMRAVLHAADVRSSLSVPLIVHERLIGALSLGDSLGRAFSEPEVTLAQAFADEAALVLENVRLYVEATHRRHEAEELARVARTLTESLDVADVGQRIVDSMLPLFRTRFARLRLRQPDGSLRALAWAGTTAGYGETDTDFAPGVGVAGLAVAEGRAVRTADALADPRVELSAEVRAVLSRTGARAMVGVPLRVRGETIGALTMGDRIGRAYSDDEMVVLQTFADQAALALDNARLYEQTRQRLRQVDSLREVVEQLLGSFSLEDRLSLIARKAAELVDGDRGMVALMNDRRDGLVIRAGYRLFSDELGLEIAIGQAGLGMAVARRAGVLINDYQSWESKHPVIARHEDPEPIRGVIACPLIMRDEVIGAISVGVYAGHRRLVDADLERLQSLAGPAALAIEHSRLYEELGARLRELQDTQAQLVQAAKLSAVGQLVSGVAHELNNPLSVVIGHSQLMLARGLPPELKRPVELILGQGDRMAKIVQGLLLFSRQRQPSRGPVDLTKVIRQILELRTAQLVLSGIRVEMEDAPAGAHVGGDAHQIQQVLLNLLLNAEQAILGSGVGDCIRVRTGTRTGAEGARAIVEVIDNGPGIPAEVLPRIFDPFFTTKPVGKGTGLGLSVSYGIVQQHGGHLTAESRPGHTVFTVDLPALTAAGPPAGPPAPARPQAIGAGRHALVVEDEPHLAELVTTLLRQTGWRVDVSSGGRAALERVRGTTYDLIVSDIRMPDGSGEEFYQTATAERPALAGRFLFMTGDTANPDAWRFLEQTKAPVIEKPFTAEALLREVERLVVA